MASGARAASSASPALSFDQRVEAQEAIERVFWAKRIWPRDNPGPKPKFEEVMSREEIVAKAQLAMDRAEALEGRRERLFTEDELDTEIARMTIHSGDPATLKALMDALNNDPVPLRECLAKPALVDLQEAKDQRLPEVEGDGGHASESLGPAEGTPGAPDSWTTTSTVGVAARTNHSVVWTGTEMIVWGG